MNWVIIDRCSELRQWRDSTIVNPYASAMRATSVRFASINRCKYHSRKEASCIAKWSQFDGRGAEQRSEFDGPGAGSQVGSNMGFAEGWVLRAAVGSVVGVRVGSVLGLDAMVN